MKKSLIALAIAGVIAAPAAMAAETTVYGSANLSWDSFKTGADSKFGGSNSANALSSNVSTLGFKGSEDLGDGLTAVWQLEEQVNFASSGAGSAGNANSTTAYSSGATTWVARDTFLGLSSGVYGTLIAGIHDTPYKMATRGLDLFGNTIADNRTLMGNTGGINVGDLRLNNVIAYIAPQFVPGLTLAGATITGAEIPSTNDTSVSKGTAYSLAAIYGANGITATAAYQHIKVGTATSGTLGGAATAVCTAALGAACSLVPGDTTTAWKIGGGYTFDAFTVNAVYEKFSSSVTELANNDPLARSSWYLAGKYNLAATDAVKLAYASAGNVGSAADTGAKQYTLGYDHDLSKHTSVYALYSKLSNDKNQKYGFTNAGASDSASAGTATANSAPQVISIGVKHSF